MALRKPTKTASAHKGKKPTKRPSANKSRRSLSQAVMGGTHVMPDGSVMANSEMPEMANGGTGMPAQPMRGAVPPLNLMRPGQLAPGAPSTKPLMLQQPTGMPQRFAGGTDMEMPMKPMMPGKEMGMGMMGTGMQGKGMGMANRATKPLSKAVSPDQMHVDVNMPRYGKGTVHIGFENAAESVAKRQGLPMDRARAIIAAGARNASKKAKRANPRLSRVVGG